MTSVSWKHLVPEGRLGFTHSLSFGFVSPLYNLSCLTNKYVFQDRDQEPVVKQLTSEPVQIKDDHFSQPLDGSDSSRGAMNFPIPEVRYLIKEISVIWHLYGGKDFGSATFTASPARSRGWVMPCAVKLHRDWEKDLCVLRRRQSNFHFYPVISLTALHLIAPPLKLRSDRPGPQAGQEVEREGTLMSWWKSSSARWS